MSDAAEADLEEDADDIEEDAPPVRPGHGPRVGRPKGSLNALTADLRRLIGDRPIWFLLKIVEGQRIRVGAQGGPGKGIYEYPALAERIKAASTLADKILPSLKSAEISADVRTDSTVHIDRPRTAAEMQRLAQFGALLAGRPAAEMLEDMQLSWEEVVRKTHEKGYPGSGASADARVLDVSRTKCKKIENEGNVPYTDDSPDELPPGFTAEWVP